MNILGIESTAHTFGIGITNEKADILANAKQAFTTESGGMIPMDLMDHHVACCDSVLKKALTDANLQLKDIDLIAYSQGPGIGHALRIGCMVARTLALKTNKPLVGVNHCVAHLEIGKALTKAKNPVMLYLSGANTQVIAYETGKYRIFGETLDQGIGNFLDSFARHAGLGFPGGPKIYEESLKSNEFVELPYNVKGMDVNFGGLLTNIKRKYDTKEYSLQTLAFNMQEHAYAMVLEVAERALAHLNRDELVLAGGVACNIRLQEMSKQMCQDRGAQVFIPPNQVLVDNGLMIAWNGYLRYKEGKVVDPKSATIYPYERTDQVD